MQFLLLKIFPICLLFMKIFGKKIVRNSTTPIHSIGTELYMVAVVPLPIRMCSTTYSTSGTATDTYV